METSLARNTADSRPSSSKAVEPSVPVVSRIICLQPRTVRHLPEIDQASNLIADQELVVPSEVVLGLLHAGTKGVLAGSSKVGKTWMLLDLATSVAAGIPFLKWQTTQGKVLFINLEIHRAFIKKRLEFIKERKNLPNLDNLSIWTLRGQTANFDVLLEDIVALIRDQRYSLIILDPVYKLMIGKSEVTASGVGMLCHNIERLVVKTGAAVMYAHHFTKGNASKKKAMDRMSGSGVFARDADTIITVTEHQEEGCYAVEMTLRNLEAQEPFVVELDFPVMVERPDLDPCDLAKDEAEQGEDDLEPLLELLDENPLTVGQWREAAKAEGYSRATFFRMKKKLETQRRVQFDQKEKLCSRAPQETAPVQVGPVNTVETPETAETFETPETAASQPVTGRSGKISQNPTTEFLDPEVGCQNLTE